MTPEDGTADEQLAEMARRYTGVVAAPLPESSKSAEEWELEAIQQQLRNPPTPPLPDNVLPFKDPASVPTEDPK